MIPELETLYRQAINTANLTRWLQDGDMIKDYEDSARYAQEEEKRLLSTLTGTDLEEFRRYIDNRAQWEDAETRMLFAQGLTIGIRLGALIL